jgi:hypothetical protein
MIMLDARTKARCCKHADKARCRSEGLEDEGGVGGSDSACPSCWVGEGVSAR